MEKTFPLEILTPEKQFFSADVQALTVTTLDGELTVLADHAPITAPLDVGGIRIKQNGKWREAFQSEGFLEVDSGRTHVFVQACEWPEDIDEARAFAAEKRIRERMRRQHDMAEYQWSKAALSRAVARIHITHRRLGGK